MSDISLFGGTGFIGSALQRRHSEMFSDIVPRNSTAPLSSNSLYLISTTDNYNVLTDNVIDVETNLVHLMKTLDECRKGPPGWECFNFVSSWFVYGDQPYGPIREDAKKNPKGFYSITKSCAEDLLISYCKTFDLPYRIFRLGNVYGSGDLSASKKKNALSYLLKELKENRSVELYHDGEFYRDYIYVDDAADALAFLCKNAPLNDIFNVCSGESIRFRTLIDKAAILLNSCSDLKSVEPSKFHQQVQVRNVRLSNDKLTSLGFQPKISIDEGLTRLCQTL